MSDKVISLENLKRYHAGIQSEIDDIQASLPVELETEQAMEDFLIDENEGKLVKYKGTIGFATISDVTKYTSIQFSYPDPHFEEPGEYLYTKREIDAEVVAYNGSHGINESKTKNLVFKTSVTPDFSTFKKENYSFRIAKTTNYEEDAYQIIGTNTAINLYVARLWPLQGQLEYYKVIGYNSDTSTVIDLYVSPEYYDYKISIGESCEKGWIESNIDALNFKSVSSSSVYGLYDKTFWNDFIKSHEICWVDSNNNKTYNVRPEYNYEDCTIIGDQILVTVDSDLKYTSEFISNRQFNVAVNNLNKALKCSTGTYTYTGKASRGWDRQYGVDPILTADLGVQIIGDAAKYDSFQLTLHTSNYIPDQTYLIVEINNQLKYIPADAVQIVDFNMNVPQKNGEYYYHYGADVKETSSINTYVYFDEIVFSTSLDVPTVKNICDTIAYHTPDVDQTVMKRWRLLYDASASASSFAFFELMWFSKDYLAQFGAIVDDDLWMLETTGTGGGMVWASEAIPSLDIEKAGWLIPSSKNTSISQDFRWSQQYLSDWQSLAKMVTNVPFKQGNIYCRQNNETQPLLPYVLDSNVPIKGLNLDSYNVGNEDTYYYHTGSSGSYIKNGIYYRKNNKYNQLFPYSVDPEAPIINKDFNETFTAEEGKYYCNKGGDVYTHDPIIASAFFKQVWCNKKIDLSTMTGIAQNIALNNSPDYTDNGRQIFNLIADPNDNDKFIIKLVYIPDGTEIDGHTISPALYYLIGKNTGESGNVIWASRTEWNINPRITNENWYRYYRTKEDLTPYYNLSDETYRWTVQYQSEWGDAIRLNSTSLVYPADAIYYYHNNDFIQLTGGGGATHTHANKAVLDQITQTMIDNSHTHSNKSVLDGITAQKVQQWDAASGGTQSDWNESDSSSMAYILNKPASLPASDVYNWAKAANKPTYTADEVLPSTSGLDTTKKYMLVVTFSSGSPVFAWEEAPIDGSNVEF